MSESINESVDYYRGYSDGYKEGYNKALEIYLEYYHILLNPKLYIDKEIYNSIKKGLQEAINYERSD